MIDECWCTKRFEQCAELIRKRVNPSELNNVPYIGLKHIAQERLCLVGYGNSTEVISEKLRFNKGDILFGKLRPYFRKVIIAPFDGICSTDIWVVKSKPNTEQKFLYYWMASQEFIKEATRTSEGTRMPRAQWEFVSKIEKLIPSLREQQTIAYILGTLDNKIELNHQMCKTLEDIAQTIFKSWFVDFDPVQAKAAGKHPNGMTSEIAALFPDSFIESKLGKIPKGWRIDTLSTMVDLLNGYSFESKDWVENGMPVVKIGSIKPGIVDLNQVSYVKEDVALAASRYQLKPGDLLIGMTGYVGEVGLVPYTTSPPLLNQRVAKFVLHEPSVANIGYIYCLTRRKKFKKEVEARSHGTAQSNVSARDILSINVTIPSDDVLQVFNKIAGSYINKILQNHLESTLLEEIRDLLLPKLISGVIDVSKFNDITKRSILCNVQKERGDLHI